MPSLTAELAGVAAVVTALLVVALVVDPTLRARRAANRITRRRRHAAAGCVPCRTTLEQGSAAGTALVVLALWCVAAALILRHADTITAILEGALR